MSSYLSHSKDTKEFVEGNQADSSSINPYPSATKEWLDWQLGFESVEVVEIPSFGLIPTLYDAQLGYTDWDPMLRY